MGFFTTSRLATAGLLFVGLLCGLATWAGYEGVTAYVTTNEFCVSCHEMQGMADDYQHSIHFINPAGVRAQCADCHVPKPFLPRIVHMIGASRDVFGHLTGMIDTSAKLDAHRLDMAKSAWAEMTANGSLGCRSCHAFEAMDFARQRPQAAQAMHAPMPDGTSCITCHRGIAHRLAVVPVKLLSDVAPPSPPAVRVAPPPATSATPASVVPDPGTSAGNAVPGAGTPAPTVTLALSAPASPAPSGAASKAFIGEATVPLAATPGGTPFAVLDVSAPLTAVEIRDGATRITARLWMKGDTASGVLFTAPDGFEIGRLDNAANAHAETASNGWVPVDLDGYVAAEAVVEQLDPIWDAAEQTYEFSCAGCHVLHPAEAYTPDKWDTEMTTMAKSAHLRPDDAMVLLKWLQTVSFNHQATK
jgi:trimethylamine-N-oxide reductase (cytochrome c), cytochrome c-type subunit TorC